MASNAFWPASTSFQAIDLPCLAAAASITSCAAGQMSTPVPSPSTKGMIGSSGTVSTPLDIVILSAMAEKLPVGVTGRIVEAIFRGRSAERTLRPLPLGAGHRRSRGPRLRRASAGSRSSWGTGGVVAEGPVGVRWAGRFRGFRYEIRRWRDGRIPDVHEAIASPVRLSNDLSTARRILEQLPSIPTPVWGIRDELDAGEMWNSNSVISWVLTRSEIDISALQPPLGGRAPGWDAGLAVAAWEPAA